MIRDRFHMNVRLLMVLKNIWVCGWLNLVICNTFFMWQKHNVIFIWSCRKQSELSRVLDRLNVIIDMSVCVMWRRSPTRVEVLPALLTCWHWQGYTMPSSQLLLCAGLSSLVPWVLEFFTFNTMLSSFVCPSVDLSVTSHSTKMAKVTINANDAVQ